MQGRLLIYGATGYTGRLISERAQQRGLAPLLAGRNAAALAPLAATLGLEHRVACLTDRDRLDAALRDVTVVIHAAGPFSQTAAAMAQACLRTGTHYLDIAAEVSVIEALAALDAAARRRGVLVMPGTGFDVVPSDCLAAHVCQRLPGTRRLALGFAGWQSASRGSVRTLIEQAGRSVTIRRNHRLVAVPPGTLERRFDYGRGPQSSVAVSWGDVASAHYTTGVADIETYFEGTAPVRSMLMASRYLGAALSAPPAQWWLAAQAALLPAGPTAAARAAGRMAIVAEAEDARGRRALARLHTPEPYTFTASTAVAIADRVLRGDLESGFQTPARAYGADLVLGFEGVRREDLA